MPGGYRVFLLVRFLKGVRKFLRIWTVLSMAIRWIMSKARLLAMDFRYSVTLLYTSSSAPITTGIVRTFFRFQHFSISISRSRYLVIFSASFLITFIHTGIAAIMIIHYCRFVLCTINIGAVVWYLYMR